MHGKMGCVTCHGGVEPAETREQAHKSEWTAFPSKGESSVCLQCHKTEAENFQKSLHFTSRGVADPVLGVVVPRANPDKLAELAEGMGNHCASCHTSACGDCHISRPQFSEKGFINGHNFQKTPNPINNCTACHGSRVEKEMMAKGEYHEELKADVHWMPNGMKCTACHTVDTFHNPAAEYNHRYESQEAPKCENCHSGNKFENLQPHKQHAGLTDSATHLQCQVCHSQAYNNCYNCHVEKDSQGLGFFKTEDSWFDFKIGKNTEKSESRPYDYVVVRHVPVDPDTFSFYGDNILSNFDALPTWKYTTPHNIIRDTAQGTCKGCHGNKEIFLKEEDILPQYRNANKDVIVDKIPK
jgi:thiosulfate/3-mercaptopyruvate sulfurtransferase